MIIVTVETNRGYKEELPFSIPEAVDYFKECISKGIDSDMVWYSYERPIKGKDITRVISVKEEN